MVLWDVTPVVGREEPTFWNNLLHPLQGDISEEPAAFIFKVEE
jgi:hypothetical protein